MTDLWVPRTVTETTDGASDLSGSWALWQTELLQERITELESVLWQDEQGWLGLDATDDVEFSREALNRIVRRSRLFWLSNPLIRRGVNIRGYYTWGQGLEIGAEDTAVQQVLDRLLGDEGNRSAMFAHQQRLRQDVAVHTDGNVFAALFTDPRDGRVQARTVPPEQIADIICDPDDRARPWLYLRQWSQRTFDVSTGRDQTAQAKAYYPAVGWWPQSRPEEVGGVRVRWDAPMAHLSAGNLAGQRYGVPIVYPALDWARAHKRFLEDWYTIVRSLSRFAWKWTGPGRKASQAQGKLATTVTGDAGIERNPLPPAGSAVIAPEGQDLTPIRKTGATVDADDGRQARLMVASALEIPDTWLSGDVDSGNLATAKTLDRPTELMIENHRELWESFYRQIIGYAIEQAVIAPGGGLSGRVDIDTDGDRRIVEPSADTSLEFDWPSVTEHDQKDQVEALVTAATLAGDADAGTIPREELSRRLLTILGFDNAAGLAKDLASEMSDTGVEERIAEALDRLSDAVGDGR